MYPVGEKGIKELVDRETLQSINPIPLTITTGVGFSLASITTTTAASSLHHFQSHAIRLNTSCG